MDMSQFKEVFKSYSSLVVPLAIALLAGVLFVPTQWISSNLSREVKAQSISAGDRMQRLKVWPSSQWEEEKERQDAHENDANRIDLLVRQTARRELLGYKIFPEPKYDSGSVFDDFGQEFRRALDRLVARVNGGDCPTQEELDKFTKGSTAKRLPSGSWSQIDTAIEDNLCREKAERAAVYASATDLNGYDFWADYSYAKAKSRDEAIRNCWYSQLAYWITEDVFNTIQSLNSKSISVLTSPVKRLLVVSFPRVVKRGRSRYMTGSSQDEDDALPSYVLSPKYGLVTPYTKRASGSEIDVVHFSIDVVIGTEAVLSFMEELCSAKQHKFRGWENNQDEQVLEHNQITVLQYTIEPVKRGEGAHRRYRYGEDAVVKLSLVCEYIFDVRGYDEVKPKAVKDEIAELLKEMDKENVKPRGSRRPAPQTPTKNTGTSGSKNDVFGDL
jgi:hypothetical protein